MILNSMSHYVHALTTMQAVHGGPVGPSTGWFRRVDHGRYTCGDVRSHALVSHSIRFMMPHNMGESTVTMPGYTHGSRRS